jgi:hypothetical protein
MENGRKILEEIRKIIKARDRAVTKIYYENLTQLNWLGRFLNGSLMMFKSA